MNISILKEWKIWLLIVAVTVSLFLMAPLQDKGIIVKSISPDSPLLGKIGVGEKLNWINEKEIKTVSDIDDFENYTGVLRFMHNGKLELADINSPGLGITVAEKPTSNINFGMDLVGGTRVLLKPEYNVSKEVMSQIIGTLETRINVYGLKEAKFQSVKDVEGNDYAQIEIAGGSKQDAEDLLAKQGKFSGKIQRLIDFENSTTVLSGKEIRMENGKLIFNGKTIKPNETFELDGIEYEFVNATGNTAALFANVFTSSDIRSVCMQEQAGICTSRVINAGNFWEFSFQVFISKEGAERFAKVTKDMKVIVDPTGTKTYLDGKIFLFLDEKLIDDLSIAAGLKGQAIDNPIITGGDNDKETAKMEKLRLQSILQSGALPVKMKIVKVDQISPTLGKEFISSTATAAFAALLVVTIIIFLRYRRIEIVIPVILTSLSEVIIILGFASAIHWTIDIAAIVGIIASIGTGVENQIMIIDEILLGGGEEKLYTIKQKIKRAFFTIASAASTSIAAMIPLMFVGIGVMKGFAITTIIGILVGILIARPAFSVVAEKVLGKEE